MANMPLEQMATLPLDSKETNEIIDRATRHGAEVHIHADAERSVILLNGALVDSSDSYLFLCIHRENATEMAMNTLGHLYAEFVVDGKFYELMAEDVEDVPHGQERLVRIPRPKTISRIERRRSRRHDFQATRFVELRSSDTNSDLMLRGKLLNLSVDGLACRISHIDGLRLADFEHLILSFQIADEQQALTILGRVVSRTPAGTPNHTIVGIEFDELPDEKQRMRIAELLGSAQISIDQDDCL